MASSTPSEFAPSEFFTSGNCSHCSKIDMKLFHCPALAGRGRHIYGNIAGLPMHPQVITRSPNQCCSTSHHPVFPAFPARLNSQCTCSRCRMSNETAQRRVPMTHPHIVNSCWINPVGIHNTSLDNTNFIPTSLQNQPCVPAGHVGMATVTPVDSLPLTGMSALSYHHHHFHHYHYHHHAQSRNNLHPYALPVFHPRLRRQTTGIHRTRHNEENPIPHNLMPILTSDTRVTWQGSLDTEQLENVVNFEEQLVDQKPKGIAKSVLENLPTYRVASKNKNIAGESRCVICLMDFEERQQLRILPCHHEYHSKCIDKWLKSNRSCPICRKEIKII